MAMSTMRLSPGKNRPEDNVSSTRPARRAKAGKENTLQLIFLRRAAAVACWLIAGVGVLLVLGLTAAGWTYAETTARVRGLPWHTSLNTRLNDACLYGYLSGAVIVPTVAAFVALGCALWG